MTVDEFLAELREIMQRDEALTLDTALKDLDEWDSLSALGVAAFFDRCFAKNISSDNLKRMQTVRDIVRASGLLS